MIADDLTNGLIRLRENEPTSEAARASVHDYAILQELRFVRREAQAEANLAYEAWCRDPCRDCYAVYVAAQDRADAAQDQLAKCAGHLAM